MTCEQCQELLLLYVTGALEPGEEAAVRAHLAKGCPACAAELAANEATVHQLPLALPAKPAPASAWDELETRIALEEPGETKDHAILAAPFTSRTRSLAWTGWAAAAAIALVMGAWFQMTTDEMWKTQKETMARAKAAEVTTETLRSQVDSLQKNLDAQQIVEFPISSPTQPDAKGKAIWNKAANTLTVNLENVKPLDAGKTYELWIVTAGGSKLAAGISNPDATGKLNHLTNLPTGTIISLAAFTDENGIKDDNKGEGAIQFVAQLAKAP